MNHERKGSEELSVEFKKDEGERITEDYFVLKATIKDILKQAGCSSLPHSYDRRIGEDLAQKLGVENRYDEISDEFYRIKKAREQQHKNPQETQNEE